MSHFLWRCLLSSSIFVWRKRKTARREPRFRARLEELESRLAPAAYAVNAHLEISRLDHTGSTASEAHAVVFFESNVADYQVLSQGLASETVTVRLDAGGDGLREMAAFLASRRDLTSVGVVAHGSPGEVALGTTALDLASLRSHGRELSIVGSALSPGGELDLWSCDAASGPAGEALVRALAVATGAGVAAATHTVGSAALGGSWQLNVRSAGARGEVPFSAASLNAFHELLGPTTAAASMITGREYFTATPLNNGKVLIAGGEGTGGYLASAELYDPTSNTWSSAGSMASARFLHTATLLGNGMVLVTGGFGNSGVLASAELYNPASNAWSSAGSMATARDLQDATLLANGKVLVMGGYNGGALASTELYNPVSNTWTAAAPMTTAREQFTSTLLGTGAVLVAGGVDSSFNSLATAELYDPVGNTWTAAATMASARYLQTATLLAGGKALVVGGVDNSRNVLASAELYDPAGNTWSAAGSMATPRDQHTATLLNNGEVLVTGGQNTAFLAGTELYDPVQNTWLAIGSLITARASQTATLLTNGQVLIAGGISNSGILSSAELYTPGAAAQSGTFLVSVLGGNTVVAGSSFLITVQAADQLGNPVSNYLGPASVTLTTTPGDPSVSWPISVTLNSSGFGFLQGKLDTAGSYTLTATAGSPTGTGGFFTGTSSAFTVTPAAASYFTVSAPATATTGSSFNVTVKAFDSFGNPAPGYTGTVSISSTDPAAASLVPSYTFLTSDNGVHNFGVTLNTSTLGSATIAGTTIIVRDMAATTPPISGFSAPITVQGLVVVPGGFQSTATGFTVTFSKPFTLADLTMYGFNTTTVQDVAMVGAPLPGTTAPLNVPGTLYLDPATPNTIVFKATSAFLEYVNLNLGNGTNGDTDSVALPDDTYTVTLVSGSGTNGFVDALNTHLDGLANGGTANYTTTFTTTFQDDAHGDANPAEVLGIPDFARGPDSSTTITVPNNKAAPGIPITLYNAVGVTDATFTLSYNPQIFLPTAGGTGDARTGSTFTMGTITSIDSTHSSVPFTYHNATAHSGTVVLGDVLATVPNSAAAIYKTKELLALSNITVTGGATVQAADGIHVDAYLGDVHVTALPALDVSDAVDEQTMVSSHFSGFSAYTLLDPVIIGNVAGGSQIVINGASITAIFSKAAHLTVPLIPNIPAAVTAVSVGGADPTLSLAGGIQTKNGSVSVSVMLDQPHPEGSTGMTEAHLALTYDPSVLSVSPSDITLGSIPGLGTGWQITSVVDAATGQIGINLFNLARTPITATQAGSLVNIAFQVVPGTTVSWAAVQLASQATPNGQLFVTDVDVDQGPLTLSPGMDHLLVELSPSDDP